MIEVQIRRPCSKPGVKAIGIAIHCTECRSHTYSNYLERIDHKSITEWVEISAIKGLMGLTFFGSEVQEGQVSDPRLLSAEDWDERAVRLDDFRHYVKAGRAAHRRPHRATCNPAHRGGQAGA